MGLRLFPLKPNSKQPAINDWQRRATSDSTTIEAWFFGKNAPFKGCNAAVATGEGVIVIDADCKDGRPGLSSLELLEMSYDLPQSFRVKTPSGGLHVYLSTTESFGNVVNHPDYPGIDIRGDGGYVVAPGSELDGVPYAVVD